MKERQSRPERVLLVLGHGKTESLCRELLSVVQQELEQRGVAWRAHDLLADGFDPVLRLQPGDRHARRIAPAEDPLVHRYQEDVIWADAFVFVHPVWWFSPPAVLKGWIDRVLADQVAVDHTPALPAPMLGSRRALLVQTFNAMRTIDRVVFRGLSEQFWRRAVFFPVGIRKVSRVSLYSVEKLTPRKLETQCRRLRRAVGKLIEPY